MKKYLYTIALLTYTLSSFSQGVGINTNGNEAVDGAILDISSTTHGVLIPRMTEADRNAISPTPNSLLIYQTDADTGFYYYDEATATWYPFLRGGGSTNSGWTTRGNTGTNPSTNFIGTIDSVDWVIRTNNTEEIRVMASGNVGIGNSSPNSSLQVSGSISRAVNIVNSTYTVTSTDHNIIANASSASFTITLPSAIGITGREYFIKKTSAPSDTVTIAADGTETIDGATNLILSDQYSNVRLISDGTNWIVVGSSSTTGAGVTKGIYATGSAQAIPTATYITATYTTIVRDDFGNGLPAGQFTVPAGEEGWYTISAMQQFGYLNNAPSGLNTYIYIRNNGVIVAEQGASQSPDTPNSFSLNASTTIYLNVGDVISCAIRHNATHPPTTRNSAADLSIVKLP